MNTATLCPACLTELPDDYPYDHVALDRTLTTQPERIIAMSTHERREVVLAGLSRAMTITSLANHFGWSTGRIRGLLPAEHPESVINVRARLAAERLALDNTVRSLWALGRPDTDIALRTGRSVYVIADVRRRLGLATLPNRRELFCGGPR